MHRQEIDDVGPALTVLVSIAHQAGGDRVAVGLVPDQDVARPRFSFPNTARSRCTSVRRGGPVVGQLPYRSALTLGQLADRHPQAGGQRWTASLPPIPKGWLPMRPLRSRRAITLRAHGARTVP